MTLAEKLASLRGERQLSQGDLAEKLDVSRQSVSKWETGQSVPELDKIVKLADLFGVTVDQLVRDGEDPQPEGAPAKTDAPPAEEPAERIVYVEQKRRLAGTQVFGVVLLALGLLNVLWGVLISYAVWALLASIVVVLSLPFLLSRRHPFLIAGWVAVAVSCLVLNPYTSVSPWGLRGGLFYLYLCLTRPELNYPAQQFGAAVGIVRGSLALILAFFTVRSALRWWDGRKKKAA